MPRYDVFLSHASADKPAVEHLAHKLREEKLEPFLDKWHLIPGEPWQEALEEALDQSRTCAVFIGKELGPWQNEEMRSALETRVRDGGFRVIPVLLPGGREPGKEELPRFLRRFIWVDFRAGLDDEDAFRRLLAGIRGKAPGPGSGGGGEKPPLPLYRCMAPARESFVQRSEYVKVRDALLAQEAERTTTVGITTAIQGAGGFGKTALATELCYDERVRERYPDGILWTTLGEEIDAAGRLSRVRDLIRWWTEKDPPAFETVSAASAHLRQELEGQRVLLVVDDVWRPEDVTPFQGLGPRAALLVTTRDSRTLPAGSVPIHVDAMDIPEAVRLLGAGLPDGTGMDLQGLAKRLGEWPLLLKIVNRQLRELIQNDGLALALALQEVEEALDAEGLTAFDREDLESRHQAVARTVGASLRRLSGEEVERFEQLAIFPEDKDIPLRVLEKLWRLESYAAKKLCGRLHDLSLLLRFDRPAGTIRLHDVIRAYLLKKGKSHLADWHRRLLDAFRPANGRWPELPRDESYLWNHLFHHLLGAGQGDVCRVLLLDFQYLSAKLGATDVNALLGDYSFFAEKEDDLRLVRDALRLSAHVLARNPAELAGQLLGRLLDRREAGIRSLLRGSKGSGVPWLRPRAANLTGPGGALIRTIEHPSTPNALVALSDGRVVSGSADGILRVWDVGSGQALQVLEGHTAWVNAVAAVGTDRVVSCSSDRTLRVWDLESGQALHAFEHTEGLSAMAVLDSRRVVFGSLDGTLRALDMNSGKILQIFKGHSSWVSAVAVLDLCRVVSASKDGTLRVWDVDSGQTLQTLKAHSEGITDVAVLNYRRAIFGSYDGKLRVLDLESGLIVQILEGHLFLVSAVAVFDSRRVVSGSFDKTIWVWNVESSQALQVLEGHSDGVRAVAVLDARRVVSVSNDRTLRVWDVENVQAFQFLKDHSSEIDTIAVLDCRRVVTGASDGTLSIWDVETGQILKTFAGHSNRVSSVAVLNSRRVLSASSDGTLSVWDVESGQRLQVLDGHSYGIKAVAVLDSRRVVSGSETLRVWDMESGQIRCVLEGHSHMVKAVAALDSQRVVSGADDGTLRVWDVNSDQALQVLEGHSADVSAVAVLDHQRVISGSSDRTLRVWDVESGKVECLFTLDAPVTAVAAIPDSRIIVAGDAIGRLHFFDFVNP